MNKRCDDGSAGDINYELVSKSYSQYRRPDPYIFAAINDALGDAKTVLNVGAGSGSYEPTNRLITAVEPSASMRQQRPAYLVPAIDGVAEGLPFPNRYFDAAMATFTIHQWSDVKAGLREMRRVTRGPVIVLTCDPKEVQSFWLNDYAPEVLAAEAWRYPSFAAIETGFGAHIEVTPVMIPLRCLDGFNEAYYGRPEMLLDKNARLACSAWSFVSPETAERYAEGLRNELAAERWDLKYGHLRTQDKYKGSLYLVVSLP